MIGDYQQANQRGDRKIYSLAGRWMVDAAFQR